MNENFTIHAYNQLVPGHVQLVATNKETLVGLRDSGLTLADQLEQFHAWSHRRSSVFVGMGQ